MRGTVEDVINDMIHGVYDLTDNGRCVGCGECCSNALPMRQKEIKVIQRYIKEHGIKEQKAPTVFANPTLDLTCPFMRKDVSKDRCVIYPVRPEICRYFKCDKMCHGEHFHRSMDGFMLIDVRETFFGGSEC